MQKKNIAVIFGGKSSEHEVSRVSAYYVISSIPKDKYNIYTIGIKKDGKWLLYSGDVSKIPDGSWENDENNLRAFIAPAPTVGGLVVLDGDTCKIINIDVIFPALHGKNGEDGTIQGLFELSGIPYVGCGVLSSAACMDKAVTNILLKHFGIEQAAFTWFYTHDYYKDPEKYITQTETELKKYPVFVKPANAGSSVGISKAANREELIKAIDIAAKEDSKIVIEENIKGYEVECAVMGNYEPFASIPGQIAPASEFYDYDAKYTIKAYRCIGCSGLSRVDFFVTDEGRILLNEINTLPGFTSISMYPKLMAACGKEGSQLIEELIKYAFERAGKDV